MRKETVAEAGGHKVVLMDTISAIQAEDRNAIIVCGSHGGAISGAFACKHPPALVFFNDAGGGKNDGGRAALAMLDAAGIAGATVAHTSARIGDAADAWAQGTISALGQVGRDAGLSVGQRVEDAVRAFANGGCG